MSSPVTLANALKILTGKFSLRYRTEASAVAMGDRRFGEILTLPGGRTAATRIWTACRNGEARVAEGGQIRSGDLLCDVLISDLREPSPAISDFLLGLLKNGQFRGLVGVVSAALGALGEGNPSQEVATALLDFREQIGPDDAPAQIRNILSRAAFLSAVRMLPGTMPETFNRIFAELYAPRLWADSEEASCAIRAIAACPRGLVTEEAQLWALGLIRQTPAAASALVAPSWLRSLALDSIMTRVPGTLCASGNWDERCVEVVLRLAAQTEKEIPHSYARPLEELMAVSSSGVIRQAAMFLRANIKDDLKESSLTRGDEKIGPRAI